ncbi:MAG TPA: acetate kinase [Longimicrobiales bacterium]|nr:acetate kinase [Longimicrobiales bacterium]
MNILVLNAGSSSLKFQLIRTDEQHIANNTDERLARGSIDRIGTQAVVRFQAGSVETNTAQPIRDHRAAVDAVLRWINSEESGLPGIRAIDAVGHRVVHGGERFTKSVLLDEQIMRDLHDTIDLAPLHNPHNLRGIQAVREVLGPQIPQAAVFDTAFHHTLPEHAYLYAIPYQLYRRYRLRRYGFHGTSHRYVAYRYRILNNVSRDETRLVTLHLGNGCSACAIMNGNSVDTSMGMTPLEGLVMGTRSGDLDPALIDVIASKEGLSLSEVESLLNKQSGLLGLSGLTHDMRELLAEAAENNDRRAHLAIDIFCYRIRKYIGSYLAAMGGADAVVFAGGIGENGWEIRARIAQGLEWMGLELDAELNQRTVRGAEGRISQPQSRLAAWVIPTDEELLIARDTARLVLKLDARY